MRYRDPRHPFHIVDPRPWPLVTAGNAFCLAIGVIRLFYEQSWVLLGLRVFRIGLGLGY